MSYSKSRFQKNLKSLLKNKNITQAELSTATGINRRTISGWLNDDNFPRPENLEQIATFFNVSISYFVSENSTENVKENERNNDFFKLKYRDIDEKEYYAYVPNKFKRKQARLIAIKLSDNSMNKTFNIGDLLIIEKKEFHHFNNGDVVEIINNKKIMIRRFFIDTTNNICAFIPDNVNEFKPIIINIDELKKDQYLKVIGKIIWHINTEDISKKY